MYFIVRQDKYTASSQSSTHMLTTCCGAHSVRTSAVNPSMLMLRRSELHRTSTEADPLTERISTSACAARSELLQQRLTPRWHVLQTIRSTRRQQHSLLCDASRSPCASSCVGCLTPNREGTAEKAPSDRACHGREVHKSPARPWNGQPARLSSLERFSVRHSVALTLLE